MDTQYAQTAITLSKKLAEILNPGDILYASDLTSYSSIRLIILDGTGDTSLYTFLHKINHMNLMSCIPQLKLEKEGFRKWRFEYCPVSDKRAPMRYKLIAEIINDDFPENVDPGFFNENEISDIKKYLKGFRNLLTGVIESNNEKRKSFIHFHERFYKDDTSLYASTYFEKLWLKYLVYRLYFHSHYTASKE